MENKEKIELMRKRIEFFYHEVRLDERKRHLDKYTFLNDFTKFCEEDFFIIDYCFYLGEYCKQNRKWLSDYKKWEQYKYNLPFYGQRYGLSSNCQTFSWRFL